MKTFIFGYILPVIFIFSPNTNTKNNHSIRPISNELDPITALKVTSYVATIVGFGVNWSLGNKRKKQLQEIINHLKIISKDLQEIKSQNRIIIDRLNDLPKIIDKLDNLPKEIKGIVKNDIQINELKNRYNDLNAIQEIFEANLERKKKFYLKKNSPEYIKLYQHLSYLSKYEFRIEYFLDIVKYCELSNVITNEDEIMKKLIQDILKFNRECLKKLYRSLEKKIEEKAENLYRTIVTDKKYIKSSNINNIEEIYDLSIKYKYRSRYPFNVKFVIRPDDWHFYCKMYEDHINFANKVSNLKSDLIRLINLRKEINSIGLIYSNHINRFG